MADRPDFLVRFWGVRGSYPTPGSHTLRHGGNTSCVEVRVGRRTLIFDAGSGIIRLGDELLRRADEGDPLNVALFITHGHGDHLIGFPFFAPLFDPRTNIHLFGPHLAGKNVEQLVTTLMSPPYFPVEMGQLPSRRTFHTIVDEQCIIWNVHDNGPVVSLQTREGDGREAFNSEVRVVAKFTQSHPLDGSVIYRIEYAGRCIVYATDVEWRHGYEPEFLAFVEGADLLIHDAQYTTQDYQGMKHGYGHSTIEMATEVASVGHVGELILFHHEPTYGDDQLDYMEAEARTRFARTRSAYEGMEIDLLA